MTDQSLFYGTPKQIFEGSYGSWGGMSTGDNRYFTDLVYKHLDYALEHVKLDGLFMEFGVYEGRTLTHLARSNPDKTFYGFDVFTTGLPETWFCVSKGGFALPAVPVFEEKNIELVVGLYEDSLPSFEKKTVAFMHIDCDLYSSTKTVFTHFADHIVSGTVIVFDEYYNYAGYQDHEYKAFAELLSERNLTAEPLAAIKTETASPASFIIV